MKHETLEKILRDYTAGTATEAETNAALEQSGAGVHLDSTRNVITPEELAAVRVGETPAEANGVGLLDDGIRLQKIRVTGGFLGEAVNQILPNGAVNMLCDVYLGGKCYGVHGRQLVTKD